MQHVTSLTLWVARTQPQQVHTHYADSRPVGGGCTTPSKTAMPISYTPNNAPALGTVRSSVGPSPWTKNRKP